MWAKAGTLITFTRSHAHTRNVKIRRQVLCAIPSLLYERFILTHWSYFTEKLSLIFEHEIIRRVLRQNERPCTVGVPKLGLGEKILQSMLFCVICYNHINVEVFIWW